MVRRNRVTHTLAIEHGLGAREKTSARTAAGIGSKVGATARWMEGRTVSQHMPPNIRSATFALLLCLACAPGWAQQSDQQQMRGLDEQVQEIKSDVLSIAQDLRDRKSVV